VPVLYPPVVLSRAGQRADDRLTLVRFCSAFQPPSRAQASAPMID